MTSVADGAHCRRNRRGKKEKGGPSGNRLKGWMLAVPRCSGGGSEHLLDRWATTAAATKAPQRGRPCRSQALLVDPSCFALVRSACFNRGYWCLGGSS